MERDLFMQRLTTHGPRQQVVTTFMRMPISYLSYSIGRNDFFYFRMDMYSIQSLSLLLLPTYLHK